MMTEPTDRPAPASAATRRVRVAFVDDHPLLREGVAAVFHRYDDVELVAALDSVDALADHTGVPPDVVVLDLHLPEGPSGVQAVASVRELGYPVLVLTVESDPDQLLDAIQGGALGILNKSGDVAALPAAVHAIASGESLITAAMASRMEAQARASAKLSFPPALADILRLIALGLDNQTIARRRHVNVSTVKKQIQEIREIYASAGIDVGDRGSLRDIAKQKTAGQSPSPLPRRT